MPLPVAKPLAAATLLLTMLLAGCASDGDGPGGDTLTVRVGNVFGPLAGARLALDAPDGRQSATSDGAGRVVFKGTGAGPCQLDVDAAGHVARRLSLTCGGPQALDVSLTRRFDGAPVDPAAPTTVAPGAQPPGPTVPGTVAVRGRLLDDAGAPLAGAWTASRDGVELGSGQVADGRFELRVAPGAVDLRGTAACRPDVLRSLTLEADTEVDLVFARGGALRPAAPALTAHAGPGALASLSWDGVAGVHHYEVLDGTRWLDVGGALAWGDHTPSGPYKVRAVSQCGVLGEEATAPAMAGLAPAFPTLASPEPADPDAAVEHYATFDADGNPAGTQAWRVVTGTGNCCENYLTTTRQGWILDFGGSALLFSKDEGVTWSILTPRTLQICGEGAVVPGPGGDIYAMNWEMCLGAGSDGVYTLKYVAADDRWVEGIGPIHAPFFDRPWMVAMTGPHQGPDGAFWPVRSYIFTNFNDALYGAGHVASGDGTTYLVDVPQPDALAAPEFAFPDALRFDPDADWTQPYVGTNGRGLDPGLGVFTTALTSCLLVDTSEGRACAPHDLPVRAMQRDAAGRLHAVDFGEDSFAYQWSDDVGATWDEVEVPLPDGVEGILQWDLKAHHALDRAVVAIHAQVDGGATDYAIVLEDIGGSAPHVGRVFQVGADPGTAESGVAASGGRYDFMTTGFLPDGRLVLSFTDGKYHPPAVAIQME